jgi:saccharopine dehydrogenase-like NADP-dependent oxidoreductase
MVSCGFQASMTDELQRSNLKLPPQFDVYVPDAESLRTLAQNRPDAQEHHSWSMVGSDHLSLVPHCDDRSSP